MERVGLFAVGAAVAFLATTAVSILSLFTEWSPIPAVALSILAMVAVGVAKVFGAACFAYAGPRWIRLGGLVVAVVCASVTVMPLWATLAFPVPGDDIAWHLFDRLVGLAPGSVKPVYTASAAVAFEVACIAFLYLSGPHGQARARSEARLESA